MIYSGDWFRVGVLLHAERYGNAAVTLCGKTIRTAKPEAISLRSDICSLCWNLASMDPTDTAVPASSPPPVAAAAANVQPVSVSRRLSGKRLRLRARRPRRVA